MTFSTSECQKRLKTKSFWHFWLPNALRATTAYTFSTSERQKVVRACGFLYMLTWKCASRHNGVHFFDISTSKSGPKTWSEREVLLAFWFGNVLHTTTACNFSSLIWRHGSAPAALASLLFDPPEPQIIGKTQWIATFLPFCAPASSFFPLFLFSDVFTRLFFSSLTLPTSAFPSVHVIGSLTSKLPSMKRWKWPLWRRTSKLDLDHLRCSITSNIKKQKCSRIGPILRCISNDFSPNYWKWFWTDFEYTKIWYEFSLNGLTCSKWIQRF